MNAPFVVAQANTTNAGAGNKPLRIIKVVKPESGQALTIHLGYEQKYKLDLSAIANEKITLVHIGERLIILFDNNATVIVEPFFDSMNAPLPNVTVEAGGRDFSSRDFASIFPITTDQSALTAAGITFGGNTPPSGANFRGPVVDPLESPAPLDLLGQEELPNWKIEQILFSIGSIGSAPRTANSIPSLSGNFSAVVEEESLNEEVTVQPTDSGNGNEDVNSAAGNDHDTAGDPSVTGHVVEISLGGMVSGGDLPLTFKFIDITADADSENDFARDTNGNRITSFGADVRYVFVTPTLIEGWADGRLIFTLELIDPAKGTIRFTLNDQIDHPDRTVDAGSVSQGHLEEVLGIDLSELIGGHDNSGDPITLPNPNMLVIGIIDDTPVARIEVTGSDAASVDETAPSGDETADPFSYGTPLGVSSQWLVDSFGSNPGADGLGSRQHINLEIVGGNGADSGLTATDGTPIRLFLNGAIVEGRVDGSGAVAFALTVNDVGIVTVAQYLALRHPLPSDDNDALDLAGKLNAVVVVTDGDGDVATSSADIGALIRFVDDAPQVANDTNWAREQISGASGNVLANQDHSTGAPSGTFADQADHAGSDGFGIISWTNDAGGTVAGQYGTLTVDAAGNYTYAIDNTHPSVIALGNGDTLTDTFTYTLVDGDGDAKTASLTITIFGTDRGVSITGLTPAALGGDATVNEANLAGGSAPNAAALTQTGSFTISAPDGLADLVVGGHTVISNGTFVGGTLTTPLGNSLAFTGFNAATGEVTYTYTLLDNEAHPSGNGVNDLFENLAVVLTDVDGSSATDTLSINIVDDTPAANSDFDSVTEDGPLTADGNVITGVGGSDANATDGTADLAGADGIASITWTGAVGNTVAGLYGTLTVGADGSYSYALNNGLAAVQGLSAGETLTETFAYTLIDADGDSSQATLTITINGANDGVTITGLTPAAQGGDVAVNEDDLLASRGAGESAGSDLTKESTTQTGSFIISAPDGLADLVVGGHTVISNGTFVGGTLTTPLGNSLAFTGFNAATGEVTYTYTLLDNEAHPSGNGVNDLFENLAVVLTDVDGSSATDTLSIRIVDDVPAANEVIKPLTSSGHDTNLMLILDVSGSMDDPSGLTGLTRLDVMKAAVNELLEQYDNLGDVRVRIVTFSSSAFASGSVWMTVDQAKAAVAALTADGSTNYDAALSTAQSAFASAGKLITPGVKNVSYFMSDGEPNAPSGSAGINATEEAAWASFLTTNQINSFALGMGTGVTQSALNPIAYDGQTGTNTNALVVTDMTQLEATLVGTITGTTGNLLTDGVLPGSFGADGGYVKSVTVDGTTYTYDPAGGGSISVSGGPNNGSFNPATKELTVNTSTGAVFIIDMDGGTFSYTAPASITGSFTDMIPFVLSDNDGDTAGNVLRIVVSTVDHAPIVRDDVVITNVANQSGNDQIVIPDFALLFNDSDAEGHAIAISSVSGATDGSVSHAGVNVIFTEESGSATDGGTFIYIGTANGLSDTASVTLIRQTNKTINGTGLGDILLGRDGANNTLNGNEGNDVLIGGNQDDTLNGGAGNDLMVGGAGNDTYVVDSANDVVVENAGEGTDTVQASVSYTLGANVENLTLTGSANINGTGNSLNNVITGNSGNNVLDGGAGNDTLNGGAGNDTLIGGAGNDTLNGGAGNDTYVFGLTSGNDTIIDSGGTDAITVLSSGATLTDFSVISIGNDLRIIFDGVSLTVTNHFTGSNNVETLSFVGGASFAGYALGLPAYNLVQDNSGTRSGGSGNDILVGDSSGQSLTGGSGDDLLFGHGGNDTLIGGAGRDLLVGGAGNDIFVFDSTGESGNAPTSADVIADFIHGQDRIDVSNIDANSSSSGNQAFVWGGTTPTANGIWYTESGGNTLLYFDTNGNTASIEMMIVLTGINKGLTASDFVL